MVKESSTPVKRPGTPTGPPGVKRMYFTPSRTPTPPRNMEDFEDENVYPRFHSMSPQEILESLTTDPNIYESNITCIPRLIPSRDPQLGSLSPAARELVDKNLMTAYFQHLGLDESNLFSHQAEAIEALLVDNRRNTCIATSTSSGKSLAFNLPILSELLDSDSTALYVYPTKALTQDQKRAIDQVTARRRDLTSDRSADIVCDILDGDVKEPTKRFEILESCNLVLTNPDMLHFFILPYHRKCSYFLKRIRFIVIDEAHAYHGAFGGHVASVIRRLRRVIEFHQKNEEISIPPLQFVLCSATIGNPAEHVSNLVGIDCDKLIVEDGSPAGERILTVWNSRAGEGMGDIVKVLAKFVCSGVRFICFCKNRFQIERVLTAVKTKLGKINVCLPSRIVAYRAGYSIDERRRLEQEIFSGSVLGVVATTALELGMDIGSLDVAISFGFPGSIHSLWQQWGRAGRGSRSSLCMLFCKEEDYLDQFLAGDVDERLLELEVEDAVIQTTNPSIVKDHLICADQEINMKTPGEWVGCRSSYWPTVSETVFQAASKEAPFVKKKSFSIRNIDARKVTVECDRREIDSFDITKAVLYVYPGAVHFVQGEEFRIVDLKLSLKADTESKAIAVRASHEYFTRPYDVTTVTPQLPAIESMGGAGLFNRSRVDVSLKVSGFNKITKKRPHERVAGGFEALELPTIVFNSQGVWIDVPRTQESSDSACHGAAHAIFFAACRKLLLSSQSDIRCACTDTLRNRILIYDSQKDGVGAAEAIFRRLPEIIGLAKKLIQDCPCQGGCMRCLLFTNCGLNNELISKDSALRLLNEIASIRD